MQARPEALPGCGRSGNHVIDVSEVQSVSEDQATALSFQVAARAQRKRRAVETELVLTQHERLLGRACRRAKKRERSARMRHRGWVRGRVAGKEGEWFLGSETKKAGL